MRRPFAAIFGLPQYGQRSGGLTGDDGGDLTARLDMRVFIAQVARRVTNLQEDFLAGDVVTDSQRGRRWRAGRGFAKRPGSGDWSRICKVCAGKGEKCQGFRGLGLKGVSPPPPAHKRGQCPPCGSPAGKVSGGQGGEKEKREAHPIQRRVLSDTTRCCAAERETGRAGLRVNPSSCRLSSLRLLSAAGAWARSCWRRSGNSVAVRYHFFSWSQSSRPQPRSSRRALGSFSTLLTSATRARV
jgi:hypothetical protein